MDTSPEAERVQIELIKKASVSKRFSLMQSWSCFIIEANRQAIRKAHPNASEEEIALIFIENCYGKELADRVRADLERRKAG